MEYAIRQSAALAGEDSAHRTGARFFLALRDKHGFCET
jgi:hypothetical protein